MQIIIRPAAAADTEQAYLWYERQRAGLGDEFLAAIQTALDDISVHPATYPLIHRDARRALLRRFPYGIFYRMHVK